MVGQFFKDDMVQVTGETTGTRCYASRSDAGALSVFLVNKELTAQSTTLNINNHHGTTNAACWQFTGTDVNDTEPVWKRVAPVSLTSGSISLNLPATSITVLDFAPKPMVRPSWVTPGGNEYQLSWASSESWSYSWQRSTTMQNGSWQNLPDAQNLIGADGLMQLIEDYGASRPPKYFYRLNYQPLPAQ